MKRIIINKCHFCGGTEFITVYQSGYASASSTKNILRSTDIYHTICRDCGSIVRSYVKNPEKLLKRSERRKATPHKTCAEDAPSDFSSDCLKTTQEY